MVLKSEATRFHLVFVTFSRKNTGLTYVLNDTYFLVLPLFFALADPIGNFGFGHGGELSAGSRFIER